MFEAQFEKKKGGLSLTAMAIAIGLLIVLAGAVILAEARSPKKVAPPPAQPPAAEAPASPTPSTGS